MEDTLLETETTAPEDHLEDTAQALGNLLYEHKGADVLVLDLREMDTWTDFFVIATATSNAHLDGLERHIKEFCRDRGIEILRRSFKPHAPAMTEDQWRIIDLGSTVIHLMSRQARDFYELERLYSKP